MALTATQYLELKRTARAVLSGTNYDTRPQFPSTVAPSLWFDGRQPMYQDLAGTIAASIGDPLGRINEPSPLTGNWQAPINGQRGRRDTGGARLEYCGSGLAGSQNYSRNAVVAVPGTDATLAVSFLTRDAAAAPQQGLLRCPAYGGIYSSNGSLVLTYNNAGANWVPSITTYKAGARVTAVFRLTATGLKVTVLIDGVQYTDSLVVAVTGSVAANAFGVGVINGADQGVYGTLAQAIGVSRAVSDVEALQMAQWMESQGTSVAYPTTQRLFAVQGDSIARNVPGTVNYSAWAWLALQNIKASAYPDCEIFNGAASGAGAAGVINSAAPYYSAQRARNVMVIAVGTNDLAGGSSAAATLTTILAQYDAAASSGWLPLIATVLDRTGALSVSQAAFDAARASLNASILSSGRSVIDMTGVSGVSANGASAGANFIGDGVHPGTSGHALMEPVYRAAMLARAA